MKLAALALAAAVGALFVLLLLASSGDAGYEANYTLYVQSSTPYGVRINAVAWTLIGWSKTRGYMILKPVATQVTGTALYAAVEDGKTYVATCSGGICVGHVTDSPVEIIKAKIEKRGVCQHVGRSGEVYVVELWREIFTLRQETAEACVSGDLLLWAKETYKIDARGETYTVTIWINVTELRKFNPDKYREVMGFVKGLR